MPEQQTHRSETGFGPSQEPMLFGPCWSQIALHPRLQFHGHERFVFVIWIGRMIGVPRINWKGRRDERDIVLILGIELTQCLQAVPPDRTSLWFNGEHVEEVVRYAWCRVVRPQHAK